ncbi:hypothetical protein AmDm5_2756 [Acetobacter malorum]|nr:hypothetical protein AmDm5_2756 [Acetobacter malorum]
MPWWKAYFYLLSSKKLKDGKVLVFIEWITALAKVKINLP